MSVPTMLSFDEIHKYMLDHGGKVTNHDLVKHFKKYLTDPSTRDEARNVFKKHVNTLASIKNQNNEKWLILKKKYMPDNQNDSQVSAERLTPEQDDGKESSQETVAPEPVTEPPPYRPPPVVSPTSQNSTFKYDENIQQEPFVSNVCSTESDASVSDSQTVDHTAEEAVETTYENNSANIADVNLEDSKPSNNAEESFDESNENVVQLRRDLSIPLEMEQKISVKERKQMFNRMASEGDVLRPHPANNRKIGQGADDDDRASVVSLDPKGHEWIVAASQGNYHVLAKLCTENPKYAKIKTAMHWASKYGNEDLVKLLAGVYRPSVNERSGYTPLHIAAQYRNENVCKLLINTYDADPNVRDWSGRKPRQYLVSDDASLSADAFRNFKMKAA